MSHFEIVIPDLPVLKLFGSAAERVGWRVHWTESGGRAGQVERLLELIVEHLRDGAVTVVTGDLDVLSQLPDGQIVVFDNLNAVPNL